MERTKGRTKRNVNKEKQANYVDGDTEQKTLNDHCRHSVEFFMGYGTTALA